MNNLEKEVCKKFKVKEKRITDKIILDLLELLTMNFGDIGIIDCEQDNCNYSLLVELGEPVYHDDEMGPGNQGYGWNIREAVLSSLLSDKIKEDSFVYDDIQYILMNKWEKIKENIWT